MQSRGLLMACVMGADVAVMEVSGTAPQLLHSRYRWRSTKPEDQEFNQEDSLLSSRMKSKSSSRMFVQYSHSVMRL